MLKRFMLILIPPDSFTPTDAASHHWRQGSSRWHSMGRTVKELWTKTVSFHSVGSRFLYHLYL